MYEKLESLWDELKASKKPLVLYGTGNGADKIIDVLEGRNIGIDAVFASSGFVRERTFRGFKVESFGEVTGRLGFDINVLLCFGTSRPEVTKLIESVSEECSLFIPEVPLYGGALFDKEYLINNESSLLKARELFDSASKRLFDDAVAFRMTGKYEYLSRTEETLTAYLRLAKEKKLETVVDLGAYTGDTLEVFASLPDVKRISAVEPDPKSFSKLKESAERYSDIEVSAYNFAASDENKEVSYSASGSRGAGHQGKNRRAESRTVSERTLDSLNLDKVDLIKFDVEGDEQKALNGAADTIERCRPALAVSLYHRTEDIFALPLYLKEQYPYLTHFSLTRPKCIPLWDLLLIAY